MRKLLMLWVMVVGFPLWSMGLDSAQGWCENGGILVKTKGNSSTTTVQGSYPSCRITVYISGTTTLASIYSDNAASPTPIPGGSFTATSTGKWQFYAANGTYDVVLSGGTPSPGISPAFTLSAVVIGGITPGVVSSLPTCNSSRDGITRAVTNSTTAVWGETVVGGGSNHVLAYCNGTTWSVTAK